MFVQSKADGRLTFGLSCLSNLCQCLVKVRVLFYCSFGQLSCLFRWLWHVMAWSWPLIVADAWFLVLLVVLFWFSFFSLSFSLCFVLSFFLSFFLCFFVSFFLFFFLSFFSLCCFSCCPSGSFMIHTFHSCVTRACLVGLFSFVV